VRSMETDYVRSVSVLYQFCFEAQHERRHHVVGSKTQRLPNQISFKQLWKYAIQEGRQSQRFRYNTHSTVYGFVLPSLWG
jgi:hypothetical protein